jgi:hypothetical protein
VRLFSLPAEYGPADPLEEEGHPAVRYGPTEVVVVPLSHYASRRRWRLFLAVEGILLLVAGARQ